MSAVDERFTYHAPPDEATKVAHEQVRAACREVAREFVDRLPESSEKVHALIALQQAMMWANGAIAIHGLPADET